MIPEILGKFATTMTADNMSSLHNSENFPQQIQMQLFTKTKYFSHSLLYLLKVRQTLNVLKKR